MSKINLYIVFETATCNIGSTADGQSLYDLIYFDESKGDIHSFYVDTVPRVGEIVELYSDYGSLYFIVLKVHHSLSSRQNGSQYVKIMLRQIPLTSNEFKWSS